MNLAMVLDMVAEGGDRRVLVGTRSNGLDAADLRRAARGAAALFLSTGADNVVLLDVNSDAVPVAFLGAALAGLPFVPVNYRLKDDQVTALLERVAPAVVVAGPETLSRARPSRELQVIPREKLLSGALGASDEPPVIDPDQVAVLLFTSGTTGEPKAAVLRHRHLVSYVLAGVEFLGSSPDETQLVSVPPYHIAGITSVLTSLYAGRRMVYLPRFDAEEWVRAASEEAVTQAMVVPTMLGRILDVVERRAVELPALRLLSYGGGRMPNDTIERAMRVWPDVSFVNAYGLTETSSTVSVLTPEDHRSALAGAHPHERARLGSVGRPLPSVEVTIRDAEGIEVAAGERGEIWVRGEQVAGEYVGRRAVDDEGWFRTRDAGWIDDEGYLFLDGRLDDVIVRGGENLSPGEIEDRLLAHPAVREAAVVGVPDPEWGETVGAAVVVEAGSAVSADELREWVRERLRSTRAPTVVQFRSELPYNETGKLLRRVIRDDLSGSGAE